MQARLDSSAGVLRCLGNPNPRPYTGKGSPEGGRKPVGYGLPCSKCRLYYPADLDTCPACNHNERVAPIVPQIPPKVAQAVVEPVPDTAVIEQEREEFLRQFKSQ